MNMLIKCKLFYKLKEYILSNKTLFGQYEKIYVFGSILKKENYVNDIDLLFVYLEEFDNMVECSNALAELIEQYLQKPVDLTVLSKTELKETSFLRRLNNNYIRII